MNKLRSLTYAILLGAIGFVVAPDVSAQTYPPGMVSYWKLNEGGGTIARDSVDANHGTVTNPDWLSGCVVHGCLQSRVKGATYVVVPNSPSLNATTNQATVEAWIYPYGSSWTDGQGNCGYVVTKENRLTLCVGGWWSGAFEFQVNTVNGVQFATTPGNIPARQWYHVVGVYDGSSVQLYINGALAAPPAPLTGALLSNTDPLYIGHACRGSGYDTCYYGEWDEVAIYNRALTVAEIQQHYQNGLLGLGYEITTINAIVDVNPNTLNLKSKGQVVTAYVELPDGYDANNINVSTVQLTQVNGTPLAQPLSAVRSSIGDHDQNGKLDLMVQFDRASLISLLQDGNATLTIAGQLMDGVGFTGDDTISVIH